MVELCDLREMEGRVRTIRQAAMELKEMAGGIEAVMRNVDRVLASVRMLEINVSDALECQDLCDK